MLQPRTGILPAWDPLDPKTIIGPIITRDGVKLIDDRVKEAIAKGAKVHTGAMHDGQIYYPTSLADVPRMLLSPTKKPSDRRS